MSLCYVEEARDTSLLTPASLVRLKLAIYLAPYLIAYIYTGDGMLTGNPTIIVRLTDPLNHVNRCCMWECLCLPICKSSATCN